MYNGESLQMQDDKVGHGRKLSAGAIQGKEKEIRKKMYGDYVKQKN